MTLQRTVLADRYEVGDLIGSGGMADVHRGADRLLLRPVAIKLLRDVSDPAKRERFVQEARTLASLNHPGLVTLLDAGIDGERPYLVMELAEGLTLSQRLDDGPMPSDGVGIIGSQLALALQYAHDQGVVHRDVKPSNVLLTDERALLVDFGIARLVGTTEQHTRTGETIGSPAYLAPEQVAGEPITAAADIYSFGLVLLEALSGIRAYPGAPVEAAIARLNAPPAMPTSLDPAWRSLLVRMTHREPGGRPTAAEVAVELAAMQDGTAAVRPVATGDETCALVLPPEAPSETAAFDTPPAVSTPRRSLKRKLVPAVLVMVLAILAGAAVVILRNRPAADPVPEARTTIPSGVPASMRPSLIALHRAVAAVTDQVTGLDARLTRVDTALASAHWAAGSTALTDLEATARRGRAEERISSAQALRILRPAGRLQDALPQQTGSPEPSGSASHHAPGRTHPSPPPKSAPTSVTPPTAAPTGTPPAAPTTGATPTVPTPTASSTDPAAGASGPQDLTSPGPG